MKRVTVTFHGSTPPKVVAVYELGVNGQVERTDNPATAAKDEFMNRGIHQPDGRFIMPVDGERFLKALVEINRTSSYSEYVGS